MAKQKKKTVEFDTGDTVRIAGERGLYVVVIDPGYDGIVGVEKAGSTSETVYDVHKRHLRKVEK